jgi:hypothetical protein
VPRYWRTEQQIYKVQTRLLQQKKSQFEEGKQAKKGSVFRIWTITIFPFSKLRTEIINTTTKKTNSLKGTGGA